MTEELNKEQKQHLTELLFRQLTDNAYFRMGVAISLVGKFTFKQYKEYIKEAIDVSSSPAWPAII